LSGLLVGIVPWRALVSGAAVLLLAFALFFAATVDTVAHAVEPFLGPPWNLVWIPSALGATPNRSASPASPVAAGTGAAAVTAGQPVPGVPSLVWPVSAPVSSPFGPRIDPLGGLANWHNGIDLGVADMTPVLAAGDGTIVWAGWESAADPRAGYGWFVVLDHGGGLSSRYAHLEPASTAVVQVGEHVRAGQLIGLSGMTGRATGYHLHFEIRQGWCAVNPWPALRPEVAASHCP
jgi:murein DD-endopeptidase MepM/ murein hydrolase activator NlpD